MLLSPAVGPDADVEPMPSCSARLTERLDTTRGALYKTLHDARQKLRAHLGDRLEVIE